METPLYTLLYQSNARLQMEGPQLDAIVQAAQANNRTLGVTGLLLYGDLPMLPDVPGVFVQWLEGPKEHVRALFETIRQDPRHQDVETIAEGPATEIMPSAGRLFPDWTMELRRMADVPATLPGFLTYAQSADG